MDRNKRHVRYVTSGSGSAAGTYRMSQPAVRKKKSANWKGRLRVLFSLLVIGAVLYAGWRFLTRERGRTGIGRVIRIGATLSQSVTPFSDNVVFYDGTTLHCVSATGGNEWSYQIGTNADYDATEKRIVAWS